MSQRRGFTLVELLVVIGIIAVLIAILLPALAGARNAAKTVACTSNLRQIAMAMRMYSDANNGYTPNGRYSGALARNTWYTNLSPYLTTGKTPVDVTKVPPLSAEVAALNSIWQKMLCPAEDPRVGQNLQTVTMRTYGINMATTYPDPTTGKTYPYEKGYALQDYMTGNSRKLTEVRKTSEVWAFVDTFDVEYYYTTMWSRLTPAQRALYMPARHKKGYAVAFTDGHVEVVPQFVFLDPENLIHKAK